MKEIRTDDLYYAAYLNLHLNLARIDRTNTRRKFFCFDDTAHEEQLYRDQWDTRQAQVNCANYADLLRSLKQAIMRD